MITRLIIKAIKSDIPSLLLTSPNLINVIMREI